MIVNCNTKAMTIMTIWECICANSSKSLAIKDCQSTILVGHKKELTLLFIPLESIDIELLFKEFDRLL